MANTPVTFNIGVTGLTGFLLKLYQADTIVNGDGGDELTEATNAKGLYTAIVSESVVGDCFARVTNGAGDQFATGWVLGMTDTTTTYNAADIPPGVIAQAPSASTIAAAVRDVDNTSPAANSLGAKVNTAAGASGGAGAYAITVTVTDGTSPVQNAIVRVTEGITSAVLTTNGSGQASFSLNAGTYTIAITKSGYTFSPTTRTVTGSQAGTLTNPLVMSAVAPVVPASPEVCVVSGFLITPDGNPAAGVPVNFTLQSNGDSEATGGQVIYQRVVAGKTDAEGELFASDGTSPLELVRNDFIAPSGSQWVITCDEAQLRRVVSLTTANYTL